MDRQEKIADALRQLVRAMHEGTPGPFGGAVYMGDFENEIQKVVKAIVEDLEHTGPPKEGNSQPARICEVCEEPTSIEVTKRRVAEGKVAYWPGVFLADGRFGHLECLRKEEELAALSGAKGVGTTLALEGSCPLCRIGEVSKEADGDGFQCGRCRARFCGRCGGVAEWPLPPVLDENVAECKCEVRTL